MFIIKDIVTNKYLPYKANKWGKRVTVRATTHLELVDQTSKLTPWISHTEKEAQSALRWWLKGPLILRKNMVNPDYDPTNHTIRHFKKVQKFVPFTQGAGTSRKDREEMTVEILPIVITEKRRIHDF